MRNLTACLGQLLGVMQMVSFSQALTNELFETRSLSSSDVTMYKKWADNIHQGMDALFSVGFDLNLQHEQTLGLPPTRRQQAYRGLHTARYISPFLWYKLTLLQTVYPSSCLR